jgi:tubulin--tyrosine ligase-like protein 12
VFVLPGVLTDEQGLRANSDIYLIDHALTISDADVTQLRSQISSHPQLTERIAAMFGVDIDESTNSDSVKSQILQKFWKFANCYHLSGSTSSSNWFVMDELGSAVAHSGEPNVICVPFLFIQAMPGTAQGPSQPQLISFSIMWPVQDIAHQDYVERDFCPWITTPVDRIAHLADWITGIDEDLLEQLTNGSTFHNELLAEITEKGGIDGNCFAARDITTSDANNTFVSSRQPPLPPLEGSEWKVYTPPDDPLRLHATVGGLSLPSFSLVENKAEADILWLSDSMKAEEASEFWVASSSTEQNSRFVNQFPYEGVFCLKDNLSREVSRCLGMPKWWLPSYDLETQLPIFVGDYLNRQNKQAATTASTGDNSDDDKSCNERDYNVWIAKPSNGTRSAGHVVSDSLVRIIRSLEINKSRIAQKYIERPLLYQGKYKFDMRFVVMVRSLEPGKEEIYVYDDFWCRVANKSHHIDSTNSGSGDHKASTLNQVLLEDPESYLTAGHLLAGVDQRDKLPSCDEVIAGLIEHYPFLSWDQIYSEICHLLREVFLGLSVGQGGKMHAPRARAIYGVDVMLEAVTNPAREVIDATPKLLEVSFAPSNNAACEAYAKQYPSYVNDVFSCLFLGEQSNVTRLL